MSFFPFRSSLRDNISYKMIVGCGSIGIVPLK